MAGSPTIIDGVEFHALPAGGESVKLGAVQVGEVMPIEGQRRHSHCFRLVLPDSGASAWRPARDLDVARWQVAQHVRQWLRAANLAGLGSTDQTISE